MKIFDYISIMGPQPANYEEMAKITKKLKEIAIEKNICIITARSRSSPKYKSM